MNDEQTAPIHRLYELGDLSQAGSLIKIAADGEDLKRLAHWANVDSVRAFSARIELRRLSRTSFSFEAELEADIVQSCVVTLDPVATHIAKHIARELHFSPLPREEGGELTLSAGDEDVPEEISSLDYDLAAPLLEEFLLAIDPYPRKEGVAFEPPAQPAEPPQSPFAVLKRLNEPG
ncbi:MAG TPA: hypothetical protein VGC27_01295 [Rhizomicrobium sp.]